jgi:hypothetical protein
MLTIYAEVVTHVAGSLEAGGLSGYPESKINVFEVLAKFCSTLFYTNTEDTRP